jgi:kynureninase
VEPALEEVADAVVTPVEAHRVQAVQTLHALRELRARPFDEEVEVVVEERPDPDAPAVPTYDLGEELAPRAPVDVVEEDLALLHAAADDVVVRRARELRARDARHSSHGTGGLERAKPSATVISGDSPAATFGDSPEDTSTLASARPSFSVRLRVMRALLDYRSEFPILAHTTYLINHSLGAMPARVEERVAEYARTWRERGIRAWGEGWWTMPMTVGDQIGRIVGAAAGSTVMHQNVAIAEAVVLSSFAPSAARNRVVYERGNFPSVRYLYQAQRELEVVVCEDDEDVVEAIDERTLLVPISHVLFKSGEIQDVARIVRRAHDVGAYVVLDAYQSAGIVPLDVTALDVDFAVGGSVKWLCGGPGNGWLYIRPDLAETLEPTYTGWQAHEEPFAFEEEMRYASGAARFLTGTPNVPALYAGTAGYDLIEEIGVERIRANSVRQTELLIRLADAAGFGVASPRDPERRGGTVTVHVDDFPAVHKELAERQILCDFRPGAGIRLGPHYYTSDGELEHVIAEITAIVETGAHRRHVGAVARH